MAFIRKNSNFLFVIILPVYLYIVQNSITNKHTHFYPNGIVVTHSHPVEKDSGQPINSHNHTKTEICFYASLHSDIYFVPVLSAVEFGIREQILRFYIPDDQSEYISPHLNSSPRGPPANIS